MKRTAFISHDKRDKLNTEFGTDYVELRVYEGLDRYNNDLISLISQEILMPKSGRGGVKEEDLDEIQIQAEMILDSNVNNAVVDRILTPKDNWQRKLNTELKAANGEEFKIKQILSDNTVFELARDAILAMVPTASLTAIASRIASDLKTIEFANEIQNLAKNVYSMLEEAQESLSPQINDALKTSVKPELSKIHSGLDKIIQNISNFTKMVPK